jgi:hypothetical protein
VDWLPEVALVPDQPPEAEQEVALVEDQLSVEAAPLTTDVGFAVNDTVGGGVAPDTVYVMVVVVVTPFASVESILTVCWPGAPGTCEHGFQSPHITYGAPPSTLTGTLSNVKFTDFQFWSVVSLMKVKFLDGSVALLITTPFVILITSVPAVSQRTRLIPGPADCAWALNPARLESQKKTSAPKRRRCCRRAPQACLVMLRPFRSYWLLNQSAA